MTRQETLDVGDLIAPEARIELVVDGFTYTEGLVWDFAADALLFHDLAGDARFRWNAADGLVELARPTEWSNGMAFDADNRLLVCVCGGNRVTRREHDGTFRTLASHYKGRELNSPNDIVVHDRGDIYFTDPGYGRVPAYGILRPQELDHQGVYRIHAATGELELLTTGLEQPNGLCFSPDQRLLYVDDTQRGLVDVFDVDAEGRLRNQRTFAANVGPAIPFESAVANDHPGGYVDGLKCDAHGNVYVTGPGGICVFGVDGTKLGVIDAPENVANFCFGDPDGRTLYIGCATSIRRLRMVVAGSPAPGFRPRTPHG